MLDQAGFLVGNLPLDAQLVDEKSPQHAMAAPYAFGVFGALLGEGNAPIPSLIHHPRHTRERTGREFFSSVREALASDTALHAVCPRCGRILTLDGEYVPQSPDKYIAIGRCRHHGRLVLRLLFHPEEDGVSLRRSAAPAAPSTVAYVHTKQFQAARAAAADPDEALRRASRSNMPLDS